MNLGKIKTAGRNLALCASLLVGTAISIEAADPLDSWHLRVPPGSPTTEDLEGVAYGNNRWVIVGESGTILSSPDGVEWTAEVNPAGTAKLNDVTFGNGTFVAIGSGNNLVLTSPDGRSWTRQSPKAGGGLEIIHDGTRFVALAAGGFLSTSEDGVNWENPGSVPQLYVDIGGIAHGNGVYVAAGYTRTGKPTDLWSATGLSGWQFREANSSQNMMGVAFALGQFVAVGQKGTLITSPDGVEWSLRPVPHTGFIWDVCAGGRYFAAACQWGRVLTSSDGVEWTKHETGAADHLTDIAFGNGTFVAVGWRGLIVQSDAIAAGGGAESIVLSRPTNFDREVRFSFNGKVGQQYQVQSTSNWVSWTPAVEVTCSASPMDVTLPSQDGPARFYRVVKPD